MRLDLFLFQFNYVKSRQKAKSLIEDGNVTVNGKTVQKASYEVDVEQNYDIKITDSCPYVSRGGLKLEKIINDFSVDVSGKTCIDIGASTGGFTHCLLLNGAKKVYAVDSGTNQLDLALRNDERVVSIENYNARNISAGDIGELADIITMDVSFISQCLILPNLADMLTENGMLISLIKPQFEVGKSGIGKGGIVKSEKLRKEATSRVIDCAANDGLALVGIIKSPIEGGDGNVEYLAYFRKGAV